MKEWKSYQYHSSSAKRNWVCSSPSTLFFSFLLHEPLITNLAISFFSSCSVSHQYLRCFHPSLYCGFLTSVDLLSHHRPQLIFAVSFMQEPRRRKDSVQREVSVIHGILWKKKRLSLQSSKGGILDYHREQMYFQFKKKKHVPNNFIFKVCPITFTPVN